MSPTTSTQGPRIATGMSEWGMRHGIYHRIRTALDELRRELHQPQPERLRLGVPGSILEFSEAHLRDADPEHTARLCALLREAANAVRTLMARLCQQQQQSNESGKLLDLVKTPLLLETRSAIEAAFFELQRWESGWAARQRAESEAPDA